MDVMDDLKSLAEVLLVVLISTAVSIGIFWAIYTLCGIVFPSDGDEQDERQEVKCEYVTSTYPMWIGKQLYPMPYQECIPTKVEVK